MPLLRRRAARAHCRRSVFQAGAPAVGAPPRPNARALRSLDRAARAYRSRARLFREGPSSHTSRCLQTRKEHPARVSPSATVSVYHAVRATHKACFDRAYGRYAVSGQHSKCQSACAVWRPKTRAALIYSTLRAHADVALICVGRPRAEKGCPATHNCFKSGIKLYLNSHSLRFSRTPQVVHR